MAQSITPKSALIQEKPPENYSSEHWKSISQYALQGLLSCVLGGFSLHQLQGMYSPCIPMKPCSKRSVKRRMIICLLELPEVKEVVEHHKTIAS